MILDRSPHATADAMWDELRDAYGVSEQTLQVVTAINGYSRDTMEAVLYVHSIRSTAKMTKTTVSQHTPKATPDA
jgi:hydroxylamine reductase (hybrid-cluster protein)